ncbi:ferredoxin-fold anticodon-binding domain-containing protein 1, partial [Leuresthes tenuis]|uniref:ferredoxin-fold anticodon-binding domain-containing protein 1 n=1 Tax=Leuresthes tenuis TaxID=355514 RepID=UPI003B505426
HLFSLIRRFLSSDSVHPVKLVQDFLLEALREKWPVSMATESVSFLVAVKRQPARCGAAHSSKCYLIRLLQRDLASDLGHMADTVPASDKGDRTRCKGEESARRAGFFDVDAELESVFYMLRPSLLPQIKEPLTREEAAANNAGPRDESGEKNTSVRDEARGDARGVARALSGISGVVFRNLPVGLWALPAYHELFLRGVFPAESEPVKFLARELETLLAPHGVSIATGDEGLHLTAQPMGLVGEVFASNTSDDSGFVRISISLNLDLLAVLLHALPDWRLLWSHDQRFLKQFLPRPPPGTPFRPFSLFPEPFSFDISLWTGPAWDEKKFHAAVREAGHGTVEHVKLIDTFSHPDLSQTSYCYRLVYHAHTHALSHRQALKFHKHLESLLSSRLEVIIR